MFKFQRVWWINPGVKSGGMNARKQRRGRSRDSERMGLGEGLGEGERFDARERMDAVQLKE